MQISFNKSNRSGALFSLVALKVRLETSHHPNPTRHNSRPNYLVVAKHQFTQKGQWMVVPGYPCDSLESRANDASQSGIREYGIVSWVLCKTQLVQY